MFTSNTPDTTGIDINSKVKMDAAIADGDKREISFAKRCVNICSQQPRKMGGTGHTRQKRE